MSSHLSCSTGVCCWNVASAYKSTYKWNGRNHRSGKPRRNSSRAGTNTQWRRTQVRQRAPRATGSRRRRSACGHPWRRSHSARSRGASRWSPRRRAGSAVWRRSRSSWGPPSALICAPSCPCPAPAALRAPPPAAARPPAPGAAALRWALQPTKRTGQRGHKQAEILCSMAAGVQGRRTAQSELRTGSSSGQADAASRKLGGL